MHRLSRPPVWVLVVLLWVVSVPAPIAVANEPLPEAPEQQLAAKLSNLKSLQANFAQNTLKEGGEVIASSNGSLSLKNGGRFRIVTREPFPQVLTANGQDLYTYDEDLQQVIVQPLVKDVKKIPILLFGSEDTSFLKDYDIQQEQTEKEQLFVLTPRGAESVFTQLELRFNGELPASIYLQDSLGQSTQIQLDNMVANAPIDDQTFEFVTPDNVDLIDDR